MDDTIVVTDLLLYWRHWFQLVHPNLPHKFPSITVKNGYTAAEILDQWTDG